mmetsp:Transcript_8305/g.10923  ORF Transcript_8305/g.10923 Transcript_8305/m.10923 type:complete len:253 (+) Transcript_8305:1033-1791(+)
MDLKTISCSVCCPESHTNSIICVKTSFTISSSGEKYGPVSSWSLLNDLVETISHFRPSTNQDFKMLLGFPSFAGSLFLSEMPKEYLIFFRSPEDKKLIKCKDTFESSNISKTDNPLVDSTESSLIDSSKLTSEEFSNELPMLSTELSSVDVALELSSPRTLQKSIGLRLKGISAMSSGTDGLSNMAENELNVCLAALYLRTPVLKKLLKPLLGALELSTSSFEVRLGGGSFIFRRPLGLRNGSPGLEYFAGE